MVWFNAGGAERGAERIVQQEQNAARRYGAIRNAGGGDGVMVAQPEQSVHTKKKATQNCGNLVL